MKQYGFLLFELLIALSLVLMFMTWGMPLFLTLKNQFVKIIEYSNLLDQLGSACQQIVSGDLSQIPAEAILTELPNDISRLLIPINTTYIELLIRSQP